jgi:hypothetical protein
VLAAAALALVLAVGLGVLLLRTAARGNQVDAVRGPAAALVFDDPSVTTSDGRTTTVGAIDLRRADGTVEWTGRATMVTDRSNPAANRLTVDPPDRWSDPLGTPAFTIERPRVEATWNAATNRFDAVVTGTPAGPTADRLKPAPITAITGPNGATATLPTGRTGPPTVRVDLAKGGATVRTAGVDLGPIDLGPLHVRNVTVAVETGPDGTPVTVFGLQGVSGALGPVRIAQANGEARLPAGRLAVDLTLHGKMRIGDQAGGFDLHLPVELTNGKIVVGPRARISVPFGAGLTLEGTVSVDLAATAGQPLVVANGTVTYGTLQATGRATVTSTATGLGVTAHLTKPMALGSGLTVDTAKVTYDGNRVTLAGTARYATGAGAAKAAVAGTLSLPKAGGTPTARLHITAAAGLALGGADLRLGADVRIAGTIGGPLDISGTLEVAGIPIQVQGTARLAGDTITLALQATGQGATGTLDLQLDRARGTVTGHATLDDLTVDSHRIQGVTLDVSSGKDGTVVDLEVGKLTLANGRTATVAGRLTKSEDGTQLTVSGRTDLLGPDLTVSGSVHLTPGRADVDLTAATGSAVALGNGNLTLGGQVHLTGNALDTLQITADADIVENHVAVTGTVALRDGAIEVTLRGERRPDGTFTVDGRYDLAKKQLTATVTASRFTFESVELTSARLDLTLAGGTTRATIQAAARIGAHVALEVHGDLRIGGGVTELDATGDATLDTTRIAVAGTLRIDPDGTRFDVTATADDVALPLGGRNLALTGRLHLSGTLDGPIAVEATLAAYGTDVAITGTITLDDGGFVIDAKATGDVEGTVHVALTGGTVDATLDLDRLAVGDVVVTDTHLAVASADGVLNATIDGDVAWRDGTLQVTGTVDRDAAGTFTAALTATGDLPLGPGVTVTQVALTYDGTTITLHGEAHVLSAKVDALVTVDGTVTLGSTPTFDLTTAADGTIALDGDERVAFTGGLRLRNGDGLQVLVDGHLRALDQEFAFAGTFGLDDGRVAVHLAQTEASTVRFTLHLTVDTTTFETHGKLEIGDLTLGKEGALHIREATVTIDIVDGHAALAVHGEADFGSTLVVEVDADVVYEDGNLTLRFTGRAALLDKFVDVGVTGWVRLLDGTVTFDLKADANAGLDFNGSGDLFIDAGFHLSGTLGQPIAIDGAVRVMDNRVPFVGTFTGDLGNAALHVTEGPGSTSTLLVDATIEDGAVTAHLHVGEARLDVLEVTDLDLSGSLLADGTTDLAVTADAQLADPSGKLAGVTSARASIDGTFHRGTDKVDTLKLKATIDRLETDARQAGVLGKLKLDYLNVDLDLTRTAKGQPMTVTITKAQLAATKVGDTYVMPNSPEAAGNDRIDLTGTITLSDKGKIQAWKLSGDIAQLSYQKFLLSGRFDASGKGLGDEVAATLDVNARTADGKITGHLAGDVGYGPNGFAFDLAGEVQVDKAGGLLDADLHLTVTGGGLLAFDGKVGIGPLKGDANGKLELVDVGGQTMPRMDIEVHTMFYDRTHPWWVSASAAAFLDVRLSNWDDPATFRLSARGLGGGSAEMIAGIADGQALAGLSADGVFRAGSPTPSFDLSVRASAGIGAEVRLLGFLRFGAGGAAGLEVHGNFDHVQVNARGMAIATVGVIGLDVPIAGGGIDVSFSADLTGDETYQVRATAHAGASLLGPVLTAKADVGLTGTVDLKHKKASFDANGNASANVLWVLARGSATGTVHLDVDWATRDATPVVTGNARIDIDAHVLFWRIAGFHADLRYDGRTLWVLNGDKFLSGDGIINRKRRVVNLRGTLYPTERLCGERQVKKRLGGWKADGYWGDCGSQGSATGRVLEDTDGSGGASPGDVGVGGLTVELRAADGSAIGSTTTEANGTWRFDELAAGLGYQIAVLAPADRPVVADPDGAPDGVIAVSVANGAVTETAPVVLRSGTPDPGTLSGLVVEDANGDGSADGDAPLADVQVRLEGPTNTTVRTGADGRWRAEGLAPGAYRVSPLRPTWSVTVDPDGTLDGWTEVTVTAGSDTTVGTFALKADGLPDPNATTTTVPTAPSTTAPPTTTPTTDVPSAEVPAAEPEAPTPSTPAGGGAEPEPSVPNEPGTGVTPQQDQPSGPLGEQPTGPATIETTSRELEPATN